MSMAYPYSWGMSSRHRRLPSIEGGKRDQTLTPYRFYQAFFCILAQLSRRETMRLNANLPSLESTGSMQK